MSWTTTCADCALLGGSFAFSPIPLGIIKLAFHLDKPTILCPSTNTFSMDLDWVVDTCFPFLLLVRGPLELALPL